VCIDINGSFIEESGAENHLEKAVFLGSWYNVWGHLLTDALSKLWFLLEEDYLFLNSCPILYCASGQLPSQFIEILDALGIKDRCVRVEAPICVEDCYIPDDSVFSVPFLPDNNSFSCYDADQKGAMFCTHHYVELKNYIISLFLPSIHEEVPTIQKKVFFTPGDSLKMQGLDRIEKAFSKAGFIIYKPWQHSLADQINICQSCSVFASVEGSVSFNVLFLPNDVDVVLIRKLPFIVPYQVMINSISSGNITYIDAHMSLFVDKNAPYIGPFLLYCNSNLCRYMYDSFCVKLTPKIRWVDFIRYVCWAFYVQRERTFASAVEWRVFCLYFTRLKEDLFDRSRFFCLVLRKTLFRYKK
jgi:hypothetical protein